MNETDLFERLRRIFNSVDPVGIFFEDNKDEYDPEIKELMKVISDYKDQDALENQLSTIFSSYFENVVIDKTKLSQLSKEIVDNLS